VMTGIDVAGLLCSFLQIQYIKIFSQH
jgi:hypothetical protein